MPFCCHLYVTVVLSSLFACVVMLALGGGAVAAYQVLAWCCSFPGLTAALQNRTIESWTEMTSHLGSWRSALKK